MKAPILLFFLIISSFNYSYAADDSQLNDAEVVEKDTTQTDEPNIIQKYAYYLKDHLNKENINRKLIDSFNSLKISLDTDVFKFDIVPGLSVKGNYEYEVEKSYIQGNYTRRDKFDFKINSSAKNTFFPELQTPLFLNLDRGNQVIISRQYQHKTNAMKALPFNIAKLPIRAKYVDRLNEGDFISIPAKMALTTGFSYSDIAPLINTGLSGFYTMAGEFLIQVYKLEDGKVRVKIIAEKKKSRGLNFKSRFGLELFSFQILGFDVEHKYKIDWLKLDTSRTKGNIILADYIFDLQDQEVRETYNNLFNNVFKFKEAKLFAESLNTDLLDKYYVVNLEDVDRLARVDKDSSAPRVERVFKGNNRYKLKTSGISIDLELLELSSRSHYVNNQFNFQRLDGSTIVYYYPNYTKTSKSKVSIKIFDTKEQKLLSYFGLASSHKDNQFLNIGLNFDRKDNTFRRGEQRRFKKVLSGILPLQVRDSILSHIPKVKHYINFESKVSMIFKKSAFKIFKEYPLEEFEIILREHLRGKRVIRSSRTHHKNSHRRWNIDEREYRYKIKRLAKSLYDIIHSDVEYHEKVEQFTNKLRYINNEYYIMQALTILLPEDKLEEHLYLDIYIKDDSETLVDYTIGTDEYREIYNQLEYVNRYIRGNDEDLRIDDRVDRIENIQTNL